MKAESGKKVKIHYTGRLSDGTVFDSSKGREPLEFLLGSGMVIKGFDAGVTGMEIGEQKTIAIIRYFKINKNQRLFLLKNLLNVIDSKGKREKINLRYLPRKNFDFFLHYQ